MIVSKDVVSEMEINMGGLEAKVQTSTAFMDLGQIVAAEERKKKKQTKARKGPNQKSPKKKKKTKRKTGVTTIHKSSDKFSPHQGGFSESHNEHTQRNERMEGGQLIDSAESLPEPAS